jgi:hypothetical protein
MKDMWGLVAINPWYRTLYNRATGETKREEYRNGDKKEKGSKGKEPSS